MKLILKRSAGDFEGLKGLNNRKIHEVKQSYLLSCLTSLILKEYIGLG